MKHNWSSGTNGVATCMRPNCKTVKTNENIDSDDCGTRIRLPSFDADPEYIGKRMKELRNENEAWKVKFCPAVGCDRTSPCTSAAGCALAAAQN